MAYCEVATNKDVYRQAGFAPRAYMLGEGVQYFLISAVFLLKLEYVYFSGTYGAYS